MPARTPKPELLVEPAWLADHLADSRLRIFDCTVTMHIQKEGPSRIESGREAWAAAHIPGAGYLHMTEDLSAPRGHLVYNLPSADHMTRLLQGKGVNRDSLVVLYGRAQAMSVARAWWVLRASGVADVRILNGGWERWLAEGWPVSADPPNFPPGNFTASPEAARVAGKADVIRALSDSSTLLVNALNAAQHKGEYGRYGRPGRIPGSVNVPAGDMHDADGRYLPPAALEGLFAEAGAGRAERIITYCGGGIAASDTAFVLEMLGYDNVAMYDQSLMEWARDPSLPLDVG